MSEDKGECVYMFAGFLIFIIIILGFLSVSEGFRSTSSGPNWNYNATTYPTGYSGEYNKLPPGYGYGYPGMPGMPQYNPYAGYIGMPNYLPLIQQPTSGIVSGATPVSKFLSYEAKKGELFATAAAEQSGINTGSQYMELPDHSRFSGRLDADSEFFPYEYNYPTDYAYSYNLS